MLKFRMIVVDRTRSPFLKEGEDFYLGRLQKYAAVEWIEVKPAKIEKGRPEREVLDKEGEAIARKLSPNDYVVALDRSGQQYDSIGLANWLNELASTVRGRIDLIIGGPLGLSELIRQRSHGVLSLSRLTLTHEMTRLVLLEQIYRSQTILRGEKYHK